MVEISRVLKPGGIFVASTFLKTFSPLGEVLGDNFVRPLNQVCIHTDSYEGWLIMLSHAAIYSTKMCFGGAALLHEESAIQVVGRARVAGADLRHGFTEFPETSNKSLHYVRCDKAPG